MTMPVDVAIRADANLGRALRRVLEALPEGWGLTLESHPPAYHARVFEHRDGDQFGRSARTPIEALTALAATLEAR